MADTKMTKSAGEHWVCSVLAQLGWGAALTRDGLERTDILAVRTDDPARQMVEIQVKASKGNAANVKWPISSKSQTLTSSDREWFALVLLDKSATAAPRTFILPRNHLAAATWIQHMQWQTDPQAAPGTRNTPIDQARLRLSVVESYEDRWDLLEHPSTKAPVLLPPAFRKLALQARVGLPPGHPWKKALPEW